QAGTHFQVVYSNTVAPSATKAALIITNSATAATLLTASNNVTVDIIGNSLAVGQCPLIYYSNNTAVVGGDGGNAFVLGTIEPHALGYISNNTANGSIDLVVTNLTQPLTWTAGNGTWDIASSINWQDSAANPTTYQQDAAG